MKAFKAYDIRGVYGRDFDSSNVWKIGFFLPKLLNAETVLVGRDDRASSPEVFEALCGGITAAGADVVSIGQCTTPTVYFATASGGYDAAVMITASHNPPEYNGLKVCKTGALPVDYATGLSDLEQMIQAEAVPSERAGSVRELDVRDDYLSFLRQYLPDLSKLKIGVDCSNGMAGLLIKDLLGTAPVYIYDDLDGTFPNHPPNPLEEKNCAAIKKLVCDNGLDIGLIFDGDADRVMFIDERGRYVQPDLVTGVLAEYYLSDRPGRVLHDIRTSKSVTERIIELGGEPHMWKVGHSFAKLKMRELGCIVGGELAGHYYFRDFFNCDSGILTALIVLSVAAKLNAEGKSFSACIDGLVRYANSGELNFHIEAKDDAIAALVRTFAETEKPVAVYDFDGMRIEFPDWWFSVRPSNTEPYLRLLIEANDQTILAEKRSAIEAVLTSYL
ncbi:phosphomannomutase/phosphoglucomutase [Tichowtungia aerotolerans]|uniref:Phosphomannomutase/phosphoglucomutase n=2 Tax=Tichowtungia aerotolerans TaxID=2697043 RepID=A0A6P1MAI7_9BACT|nr:phosphomannomutase/phosphoglucomutase [Tichowtungia aerotolerans]